MIDTAVILAGGKGTRLGEITHIVPKPMLQIGGIPIIQHIINSLASSGVRNFVVPVGYLSHKVFSYFRANYELAHEYENLDTGEHYARFCEYGMQFTVVFTGDETLTGGRLKRVYRYLPDRFVFTYGDGLSTVDIREVERVHEISQFSLATITVVHPTPRFGQVTLNEYGAIVDFSEKPHQTDAWINGGYMVMEKSLVAAIPGDMTNLERDLLPKLAKNGSLMSYRYEGYWHCIDTLRDLQQAEEDYHAGKF